VAAAGCRAAGSDEVVAGQQRHQCNSYYEAETVGLQVPYWKLHLTTIYTEDSSCDMLYTAAESNVALGPFDMAIYVRKP
jgi:hypothetical protein